MFTLTCPNCKRISYSSDETHFSNCPYCGVKFSGRHGSDRRCEERVEREILFDFSKQDQYLKASAINISEKGLSVKIAGGPLITEGDLVDLSVGDSQIKAKVIWTNRLNDESALGLQRLN